MYATHMLPFMSHQQCWGESLLPIKRNSRLHPQHIGWSICGSPSNFSPPHNHWSSGESQTSVGNKLHRFTVPISPACDQYVQYLLTGANPLVLNWHTWGLQSWRCWLSTTHSPPFPTDGSPLSLWGPCPVSGYPAQQKPIAIFKSMTIY
jgi:hypothetical protein